MTYKNLPGGVSTSISNIYEGEDILDWGQDFPYAAYNSASANSVGNAGKSPVVDVTKYKSAYIYYSLGSKSSKDGYSNVTKTFSVRNAITGSSLGSASMTNKTNYLIREKAKATIDLTSIVGEVYFTTNAKADYEELLACTAIHLVK